MRFLHALGATVSVFAAVGSSVGLAGNRPQPTAPPIPPSWQQPQPQISQPVQNPAPNQSGNGSSDNSGSTDADSSNSRNRSQKNKNQQNANQYPYGYPYGSPYYGQPTAGIYYSDGSSPSGVAGNPNAVPPQNNNGGGNPINNAPPAAIPAVAPAAQAPTTPPDPEVTAAASDLNFAMDHLRTLLLKNSAEYQAAVADKKAAQEQVSSLRANENATQDAIVSAAGKVLAAGTRVTQIERGAAAIDQRVQDAQARLKTAVAAHLSDIAAAR